MSFSAAVAQVPACRGSRKGKQGPVVPQQLVQDSWQGLMPVPLAHVAA